MGENLFGSAPPNAQHGKQMRGDPFSELVAMTPYESSAGESGKMQSHFAGSLQPPSPDKPATIKIGKPAASGWRAAAPCLALCSFMS